MVFRRILEGLISDHVYVFGGVRINLITYGNLILQSSVP